MTITPPMRSNEARLDRQLGAASESASRAVCTANAVDLENHPAGLHPRHPQFRRALAGAMRTSAGFFDTGRSGKILIQTGRRASCGGSAPGGRLRSGAR